MAWDEIAFQGNVNVNIWKRVWDGKWNSSGELITHPELHRTIKVLCDPWISFTLTGSECDHLKPGKAVTGKNMQLTAINFKDYGDEDIAYIKNECTPDDNGVWCGQGGCGVLAN